MQSDDIPGAEQAERLAEALTNLIEYFSAEYNMPLATAIGCLHIRIHELIADALDARENDSDTDEDE